VVARHTIHAGAGESRAAEDVASADHDRDLHAQAHHLADLRCDALEHFRIDAVILLAHERFAGQLEQDAAQAVTRGNRRLWIRRCDARWGHSMYPLDGIGRANAIGPIITTSACSPYKEPRSSRGSRSSQVSAPCRPVALSCSPPAS